MLSQTSPKLFDRQDWLAGYRSLKQEYSYWVSDITGAIPPELQGTLFRNGPGLLDVNGEKYGHPFDGDGMICRISFQDSKAHFANSFVKTPEYLAEQKAGKILYRGVFGTQKAGGVLGNLFDMRRKNIANTNVTYHGGKLFAMWEADRPYALDPYTLQTLGIESFQDKLTPGSVFSAHPRLDPATNDLWGFGVEPSFRSKISIYKLSTTGNLDLVHQVKIPGFCFLHDFAWTPDYCIFIQNPIQFNPFPFIFGLQTAGACLELKPNAPSQFLLLDRQGNLQTIDTEPCFVFHHGNAYRSGDELILDAVTYADYPKLEANSDFREVDFSKVIPGHLTRFCLNLSTKAVRKTTLLDRSCEFPRLNPNHTGRPHRYLYLAMIDPATPPDTNAPLQAIVKVDTHTAQHQIHNFAPRGFVSEPVFVPRPNGELEDDGWVLLLTFNAARNASDVVILNGTDLTTQAILHLPHHVPYGLHGNFVPHVFVNK
jgi:all-trans-8'-apo-beta-carotenal 15,15'-oxygenase